MRERAYQVFCICIALVGLGYRKGPSRQSLFRLPAPDILNVLVIVLLLVTAPAILKRRYSTSLPSPLTYLTLARTGATLMAMAFSATTFEVPHGRSALVITTTAGPILLR